MKRNKLVHKDFPAVILLIWFAFFLQIPKTLSSEYNLLLSPAINNAATIKMGLLSKITFENTTANYFTLLIFYFISVVILSLFLGKILKKTDHRNDLILITLTVVPVVCHFGFLLYVSSGSFSLFSLLTFIIGTFLFVLSFENKYPLVVTVLLILSLILHPVIFMILFPTFFVLFILNNPHPKGFIIFQIIILLACYLIVFIIFSVYGIRSILIPKILLNDLLELIFLLPLILLVFYVFVSAVKVKKKDKLHYYLSLFMVAFPLPLVFICGSFYIYLSASLGGQILLLFYFYLRGDNLIVTPLKKIQTYFSNNIAAFMFFIFYLCYLAFIIEKHNGFLIIILRDYYLS